MKLLTAAEVADRWQVPTSHVYRLAREGRIPVVELGRYRRFDPEAIRAFELNGHDQPNRSAARNGSP